MKRHITLLHRYNEVKDATQVRDKLFGRLLSRRRSDLFSDAK